MSSQCIVWDVPESLYRELVWAQETLEYPDLAALVAKAVQRYLVEVQHETWRREFRALQQQVRAQGGLDVGATQEEVIAKLREQRRQLFEDEYAHLY